VYSLDERRSSTSTVCRRWDSVEGIAIRLAAWLVRLKESLDLSKFGRLSLDCRFELHDRLRLSFDSSCEVLFFFFFFLNYIFLKLFRFLQV
jgi:hypothetical protein